MFNRDNETRSFVREFAFHEKSGDQADQRSQIRVFVLFLPKVGL